MKKATAATAALLIASTAYAACTIVPKVILPMLRISSIATHQERLEEISAHIAQHLGGANDSEIIQVRIPTQTCLFGICGATMDIFYYKPCGEDAAEAFKRATAVENGVVGWVGGGGGSGFVGGGGGGLGPGWTSVGPIEQPDEENDP